MFAKQFISNEIFPLKKSDSAESAMLFMEDWLVKELPVVESAKVLGIVKKPMLFENDSKRIDQIMELNTDVYVVNEFTHLFELMKQMNQYDLNSLAVIGSDQQYLGIVCAKDISNYAYAHSALVQEGSVLVIEVAAIHYSLAEISRICESNDAKIIHLMIENLRDENNMLLVSIKLNKLYLTHVIASLERFSYKIIYTNSPTDPNNSLDDRYNWLVKYLNT